MRPAEIAGREQKEFIAAASHELKSPLAVICASAEYLQSDAEVSRYSQANTQLDVIQDEAKQMARLVDDLLILSNSEAANMPLKKEIVNTEGMLITAYDRFASLANKNGHQIQLILPNEPLPTIEVDAQRVLQIISVLLWNAVEHTAPATPIELTGKRDNKKVIISVVDHGAGIGDKEKTRVFERFYQIDQSHTKKNNFGIGFSVAAELARLHGTKIKLSDTIGGGAIFSIAFDARQD